MAIPDQKRDESITFWRSQLQAESEVEREVAVRMLTDVYEVPLKEPDPEPEVAIPSRPLHGPQPRRTPVMPKALTRLPEGTKTCPACGGTAVRIDVSCDPITCTFCRGTGWVAANG